MALLDGKPNKGGPLEAWAAVSPDEGVRTRRRSAKIEAATLSQTQLSEQSPESLDKENEVQQPERSLSRKSDNSAVITTELWEGNKPARGLHFPKATLRPCTKPLWSLRSVSPAVTTCNDDVSVSGSNTDKAFQIYEDPDVKVGSSPRNTPDSIKTISEHCTVLEPEVLEQMLTPPTEICAVEHNNNLSVDDNSSDSSDSDDSEMDSTSSAEAMNQLKATNEDLTAENKYYRLLADITTKPAALRRGCLRSAIKPSNLPLHLSNTHHLIMTEGLKVPNSASDRAQVLANLIELHLTWDVEHLKHCIDPSPAVNSFLEFAALYIPQLQGVAIAEFVGGEETVQVRNEIAVTVMRLVSWIVEQTVMLAEAVAPHYLSYHAVGLHEEGKRALWDLDACLAAACQQKMQADADVINIGYLGVVPPLYSRPVLDWAFKQLMWIETMAGRLETKVDQVPNHYGEKVQLFCLTKEALRYHLFQGQNHLKAAEGAPQAEAARAAQAYQARY